mmetsp:Transcript_12755/g.27816  ORF Transcript_12755/g.27816 Transcript_12755/m.27816 type:complete len:167 (-) Transcript_12755:340-840(-)|eukprot:CAMPEP_0185845990 /NCGR_PEP_ID=MMETSP1354-20130828/1795_1 /TAXON_ID=708628 /ORGANISM="Erythrolobus madagascarensis, Strain CCMP3276" /LENGTH=166 /DNA_ID=CAMNT_0028546071 /DNA_START=215 /DNA_END=715 /DNA_ORIENTATION=+
MMDPRMKEPNVEMSYMQIRLIQSNARGRLPVRCMQEASFGRALRERDHAPSPRMECRVRRPTPLANIAVHETAETSSASPRHPLPSLSMAPVISSTTPRRMRCTPIHSPATPTRRSSRTPRPSFTADHCFGGSKHSSMDSKSSSPEQQLQDPATSEQQASSCPFNE